MAEDFKTVYTLSFMDLVKRPVIREGEYPEFFCKMTDDEEKQWYEETEKILMEEGVEKKFPDWNASILSKTIDIDILYNIYKMEYKYIEREEKLKRILGSDENENT